MKVTIIDTKTGNKAISENDNMSILDWTEGNWSCDCNRVNFFDDEIDEEMDLEMRKANPELKHWQSYCYGEKRFLVISVDPMPAGYVLDEFNDGYPEELKQKHLKSG